MVAIVAGNGLGLMLGSQGALGARGSFGSAALGGNGAMAYVNATTGNLVLQNQDDLLAGHGLNTVSLRTYNSQGRFNDDNGDNWTLGLYARQLRLIGPLNAAGSTIERTGRDGSVAVFSYDAVSGVYLSTAGVGAHDLIRYDAAAGELVWTEGSTQVRERHDAQGRLVATLDAAGNSLQYAYGANGLVSMITQGGGGAQRTYYDYDGTLLTQIRTVGADNVSQTRVRYGYDASRRLNTVTVDLTPEDGSVADGKVFQTTYRYDGDSLRVSGVAQSDGTSLVIDYALVGADYRVRTLTDGAGTVTHFDYDVANRRTTVTDPRQQATVYTYDGQGQLLQVDAPAVNGTVSSTRFEYSANGDVTRIVDGEGRWVATSHDAWGNPIRQTDSAGNVVLRSYDGARQLIAESVAGDGSTQSASTRYVHAQGNPTLARFVISPEGRVTEYRYNGFGERSATIEYAADVFAVSGLAYDTVPSEAEMTAWAAARDLTRTQRQDFEYDGLGQLSKSIAYATVDALGNGVADATRSMTQYVYDVGGRLLKTIDARGGVTVYTYDGLGRVLTVKDAAQRLTTTLHDDANRKLVVTQFNGLITTSSFDRAGRVVSVVEGSAQVERLGETDFFYDLRGQQLMSRDATGARRWFVYDAAGRRVGEVDALGTLTEYRFDANGQVTSTIRYATLVNTAGLVDAAGAPLTVSIESLRPASSAKDQRAWRVYDEVNRLIKEVSTLGEVTEYGYDRMSRLVLTRKYAGLIDVTGIGSKPTAGAIAATPSAADAWTRSFYDTDGRVTATLDAVGTMVENQYDAAGRLVASIRRSNRVDSAAMLTGTLSQLRPAASAEGATTRYFHDAQGRLVATLDPLNYLTEKVYDAGGNVTRELRYAARSPAATAASAVASLRAGDVLQATAWSYDAINRILTKSSDPDGLKLTTRYQYDDAGRRLDVTDPAGTVTRTVYDVQGQVKSVTVDQGGLGITTSTTYDAEGRVLTSTDAAGTVTQFGYDALGRKTSQRVDPTGLNLTTLYAYDVQGNLARVIDPNGKQTRYLYDEQGRLKYTLDAEYALRESVYDSLGRVVGEVRYAARQTGIQTVVVGQGLISNSLALITKSSGDSVSRFAYDAAGREIYRVDAAGAVTESSYDAAGRVVSQRQYANAIALPAQGSEDGKTLVVKGDYAQLWSQPVRVDPNKSYKIKVRLRQLSGQGYLYAGVMPVDANGVAISANGAYEYTAAGAYLLTPEQGWKTFEATIGGINAPGVYDFSKFFNGTVSAAALLIYNYGGDEGSTDLGRLVEVDTLELVDLATGQVVTGGKMDAGAAGWLIDRSVSGAYSGVAVPLDASQIRERLRPSVNDRESRFIYDALGRPTFTLDPLGAVTRQRFNAAGDVIETIQYGRRYGGEADLASMEAFFASASNQTSLDRSTRYIRDESGRLRFTVDAMGGVVETVYGAFGEVARTIAYDSPVTPSAVTDATSPASLRAMLPASTVNARETLYGYDADGRLRYTAISQRSDNGAKYFSVSERLYDALGRLTGTTDFATTLALQDLPSAASVEQIAARIVRSGQDRTRTLGYDAAGRLKSSTDGEGNVESYEYDAFGNKTRHINQAGSTFDYAYDAAGRLVQETSPLTGLSSLDGTKFASVQDRVFTRMSYNAFGELAARTEAFGRPEQRTTRYEYDARGRQTLVRYEAIGVYDPAGDPLATNGANGVVARTETLAETYSQTAYDVFGQAIINRDVAGVLSYKTYDKLGRLLNEVDGNHEVTTHYYSATVGEYSGFTRQGARAQFSDGLGVSAATIDAAVAAIAGTGSPRSASTYFDKLGRVSASYDKIASGADLSGAAFSYDAVLNVWGLWAGLTEYAYNAFGDVIQRAELLDRSSYRYARTRYVYDQQGRLVREVNAEGYVTQREYDAFGEQTKETQYARAINPDGDVMATPTASSSAAGGDPSSGYDRVTVTAYDRRGSKTSETLQATQIGVRWGDRSLVRRVVDVVTTFTLDKLGRQTGSSKAVIENGIPSGQTETTRTFYDELGRTRATIDEAGRVVVYDRDAHGNALRITRLGTKSTDGGIPGAGALDQTTLQRYDKLSRLVWTQAATGAETFYSRDARGLVVKQWQPFTEWSLQSGAATSAAALTVGRNAIQLFSYDGAGRQSRTSTLTQHAAGDAMTFSTEDVVYNAFGEITSRLRDGATIEQNAYDAGGRLWRSTAKGVSTVFWYDLHGNVTSSFTSDTANLVSLDAAKDVDAAARRTTTTYDRLGRIVAQSGPAVSHDEGRAATQLVTSQTLDAWGNMLSLTRNGVLRETHRYDAGNHAIVSYTHNVDSVDERGVTSSGPILSQAFFDASGRQVGAIDGAGIYSSWTYNSSWLLDTEYRGDRTQVSYQYDGLGRVTLRGDAVDRFYGFSYDNADRETGRTVFLSGGPTYQLGRSRYDELGRKISDTTGEDAARYGQMTIYWYDARGNLATTAKPMGQRTSYAYDAAGNRVRETDANGMSATWAYNTAGQLTSHVDIGGATYSYGYDFAGELKTQTSTRGQNLSYEYAANGLVRKVTDGYRGSSTTYDYDAEGNRTRETFKEGGATYRDVTSTYDRQGRLSSAVERGYALFGTTYAFNVSYDAAGNRRRVWGTASNHANESHYGVSDDADRSFDQWFTYDGMNRVVINEGKLSNGSISEIDATNVFAYDGAGRRRESTTKYGGPYPSGYVLAYEYDFADRLTKESSRMLSGANYVGTTWTPQSQTEYRKDGQQIATGWEMPYGGGAAVRLTTSTTTYNDNGQAVSSKSYIQGLTTSRTTATGQYLLADQSMSYDQVGNLKQVLNTSYAVKSGGGDYYQVRPTYKASSTTTNYSYYLQEGYKERGQGLTGTAWNENGNAIGMTPSQTYQSYDANGNVMQLQRGASDFRWYVTDTAGHIVTSYSGAGQAMGRANQDDTMRVWDPMAAGGAGQTSGSAGKLASKPGAPQRAYSNYAYQETQLYVNDRRIGSASETQEEVEEYDWNDHYSYHRESVAVSMDVSGLGYETRPQSGSMVTYTVQAGETLRSLATRFYGDEALWYRIAEANAFADGKAVLTPGATINIPNVTRALNSASSGAVYKPEALIGDVSAPVVMPPPPPAGRAGCGAMGMILVVIVTIVVSYVTYGALTSETSGIMTKLAAGAAAGAAGSVAGQATANVVGLQNGFSWKQVGMGAIGGMVTAGMQDAGWLKGFGDAASAVGAATGNAITQGIGVVTGLQDGFNWKSVAISAISAPIADKVSAQLGGTFKQWGMSTDGIKIGQGIARGLVSQTVRIAVMGKGRIDFAQVAGDAFGNAIGESLASQSEPKVPAPAMLEEKAAILEMFAQDSPASSQGLRLGGGSTGVRLSDSSMADWSRSVDSAIPDAGGGLTAAQRRAMELGLGPLNSAAAQEGLEALDSPLGPAANGRPMAPSKDQIAASAAVRARLAQKASDYWGGTGEYAPTVKDNKTLISALKDTGRAVWNLGVDMLDIADTISPVGFSRRAWVRSNGETPISFSDARATYDTPAFGATLEVLAPLIPLSRFSNGFKTLGGAAFINGKYVHDLKPLSNLELYGTPITRTPDEAVQLLRSVGHDAETLAEYRFVKLSPQEYAARVDRLGFEFDATYGNVPRGASSVRFNGDIASRMVDGSSRINVYVRDAVFESDEALIQILSHEIHETQALKYAAARPISVREYSDLVRSNLNGNLHWEAVQEGDYWLQQFRLKNGKQ